MSSSNNSLPPYQEKPSSTEAITPPSAYPSRLSGNIQTYSIRDGQIDYFSIIQVSDSTYHLSLTIDPTPLYRIELVLGVSKVGNIQIFSASDHTLPCLAAARASHDQTSKTLPVGTICTSLPTEPDAYWRPVTREKAWIPIHFDTYIPVVIVPGRAAEPRYFKWKTYDNEPAQLWWEGDYLNRFNGSAEDLLFASVSTKPGETLLEIRRGAGIEFELSVILEAFLLTNLHMKAKSA